jgi:hypothetical protein
MPLWGHVGRGREAAARRGTHPRDPRQPRDSTGAEESRCRRRSGRRALPQSDRSGHVGDQEVSAQIVQVSDALGATDPLAQRTLPRSASKHPDCRSRAGAGVDHADHIAAELERHQPPPARGRDCWFVANPALLTRLPLLTDSGTTSEALVAENAGAPGARAKVKPHAPPDCAPGHRASA